MERLERPAVEPGHARSTPAAARPTSTSGRIAAVGRISVVVGAVLPAFATSVTERADVVAVSIGRSAHDRDRGAAVGTVERR